MGKKLATQFLKDEAQAKQEWLRLLMDDENVPLDVAYKAKCNIVKEYYPYAIYAVTCSADWSARSIWEHTEEYQVPREETVYIDYQGKEHKRPGQDTEVRNLQTYHHYRKPMSRTVYDTEKRTVIDNVQDSYGSIGPLEFTEQVATADFSQLLSWAGHFSPEQLVEIDSTYLNGFTLIPESVQPGGAEGRAKNAALADLRSAARREVPGDRYEDLGLSNTEIHKVARTDAYLAVYHVFYEYEGENYECFISGGLNESDYVMENRPVDETLKARSDALNAQASKNSFASRKTIFMIGIPAFLFFARLFAIVSNHLLARLCLVGAAYCVARFVLMQSYSGKTAKEKAQFSSDNAFLKQQILELSQNRAIADDEKTRMIEEWLTSHSGNIEAGDAQTQALLEKQKQQTRLINIVAIAAVVLVIVLTFVFGEIIPAMQMEQERQIQQYNFEHRFG